MMGYWRLPEATDSALKGGWMHTGDAGYMDEEGFIYIQDRIKDMIVSGAENIYPAEVERAIFEHLAVADTAVVGIPMSSGAKLFWHLSHSNPGKRLSLRPCRLFAVNDWRVTRFPANWKLLMPFRATPAANH